MQRKVCSAAGIVVSLVVSTAFAVHNCAAQEPGALPIPSAGQQQPVQYTQQQAQAMNLANQALAPIQAGQWEVAMSYIQQALALDPNCIAALLNAGLCSNQLGRFDEGISYSTTVTQLAPERFEAWVNLGSSYQGAGRLADAVQVYQQYLNRFPNEPHRPQVQSLVKTLSMEVARQNAVAGKGRVSGNAGTAGGGGDDSADYFAYSVPDSIMKWAPENIPIKVYIPSDAEAQGVPGYIPDYGQVLRSAFKEWADRSSGAISYSFVSNPSAANIDCKWVGDASLVRTPAEGGDANILANVGAGLQHVTITILTKPERTPAPTTTNSIYATALHEVGHSLGITGHSPNPNDIMFSSVPDVINARHLTQRDSNTLAHLYRSDVKAGGQFQAVSGDAKADLSNEATNLMQQNDFAGAAKKLEAALKIDPGYKVAKINLAVCLTNSANQMAQRGKVNDAMSQYKRALELLREDTDAQRKGTIMKNYAAMLYNTQHTKEAKDMDAAATRLLSGGR
jgi:tetratricopeptide (TPR) repeat protein